MRLYDIESRFSTMEFACKCGCGFGMEEVDIDKNLINKLNILRILYNKPMTIASGARCAKHNAAVDGEPLSAHLPHLHTGQCRAADITILSSADRFKFINLAMSIGFERMGIASTFVHVDVAWDLPSPVLFTY